MAKPDLMAELAEVVRLAERTAYVPGEELRAALDAEAEAAATFLRTHHAELEAVVRDAGLWRAYEDESPRDAMAFRVTIANRSALEQFNAMHNSAREGL